MAERLPSKIPAVLLVLVGLAIVVWTVPQIDAALRDHDSYRVEAIDDGPPSDEYHRAAVDRNGQIRFSYEELTDAEQQIVRRGLNRSGRFEGPDASELAHFESGQDAPGPGHGIYYIEVGDVHYRLTVSSGGWGDGMAVVLVFIPALLLGVIDVAIGLLAFRGPVTTAGPTALLSGHAVLFGGSLLHWADIDAPTPHPGLVLFGALVAVGTVYLGFVVRRQWR
mgnify:CR=1 FL=1